MSTDRDVFRLEAGPATARGRLEARIRDRHAERDRRARREADYTAVRSRSYIVMSGEELVAVLDPAEEALDLDGVIARVARSYPDDFVIWKGRLLLAAVRRGRRRPIVTCFTEDSRT